MRQILIKEGYEDAKEYFICLSDVHLQYWGILGSQSDLCRHCGDKGTIPYYYLGLKGKIKCWVSHPDVCYKMLSHRREKDHSLNRHGDWHTKKELWDGERSTELSWFWDLDSEWCPPVWCQYPGCSNIISAKTILSAYESEDGYREIKCDCCRSAFQVQAKYVKGDPPNIAFVGKLQWIWNHSKLTESSK